MTGQYTLLQPRLAIHESKAIDGLFCCGCNHLDVVESRRRGKRQEKYYCLKRFRGYFEPRNVDDCPHRLDIKARNDER